MQDLVADFTDPGELVLDPFAGSGTTGVACRLAGRNFLGWELDANHATVARARLESAAELRIDIERDQLGLFA
jgi:site-specific DNA-methyltransferase (adenine-specific)